MSRTIVISGARSHVGKTTLARRIVALFPGAVRVKIGHGATKDGGDGYFYHAGTPASRIMDEHSAAPLLVIESNSFLLEADADMVIYLDADKPKPSALAVRNKADIVRGTPVDADRVALLSRRLGCPAAQVRRIAWLAGARPSPVAGLILAGGRSSRMGRDKAFLPCETGASLVKSLYDQLGALCDTVAVVTAPDRRDLFHDMRTIPDRTPGEGPLMGLYTGLSAISEQRAFIVACDIPHVDPSTAALLLSYTDDYQIVIPHLGEQGEQPLCGIYAATVLPEICRLLDSGNRRLRDLLDRCTTLRMPIADGAWYANLNTPLDYRAYFGTLPPEPIKEVR